MERIEVGGQRAEDRGRRTEDRGRRTEGRGQRAEEVVQKGDGGMGVGGQMSGVPRAGLERGCWSRIVGS
ncbi:MAG: hypothetical protein KKG10_18070, partial [Proteobacteria bacterium]|nr:hypothetical protein [Pseudomonadota bacterium]